MVGERDQKVENKLGDYCRNPDQIRGRCKLRKVDEKKQVLEWNGRAWGQREMAMPSPAFISCFCCNKLPQTCQLNRTHINSHSSGGEMSNTGFGWLKPRSGQVVFLLGALGGNPLPYVPQFLGAACFLSLMAPSSVFQTRKTASSHLTDLCSISHALLSL